MTPPALSLEQATYRFDTGFELGPLSFDLESGTVTGLIGPNGAGKSTTLWLASGALSPDSGVVRIHGTPAHSSRRELARVVAMVPQQTHFEFAFSVLDIVLMGRAPHLGWFRFEGPDDREIARWAMQLTSTDHLAERSVMTLSGGELARVVLARALAQKPRLLLLDEPAAHLDLRHEAEVAAIIRRMRDDEGTTILLATHDINRAARLCDRLILLSEGVCLASGAPAEVLREDLIGGAFRCKVEVRSDRPHGIPMVFVNGEPRASLENEIHRSDLVEDSDGVK